MSVGIFKDDFNTIFINNGRVYCGSIDNEGQALGQIFLKLFVVTIVRTNGRSHGLVRDLKLRFSLTLILQVLISKKCNSYNDIFTLFK